MKEKVLALFRERGLLVTPSALEEILLDGDPLARAAKAAESAEGPVVNQKDLLPKCEAPPVEVSRAPDFRPAAKDIDAKIIEFNEYDVTGNSQSEGKVEDFVALFRDRFERLSRILKQRGGNTVNSIEALKRKKYHEKIRFIGMVESIRTTKNGHRLMIVDDETERISVLVSVQNRRLMEMSQCIVSDEVLAIEGVLRGDLFIADEIFKPDVPQHVPNRADEDAHVAMISDTHVGSNLFMRRNFIRFIQWLNGEYGNARQRELAGKVKYITIAGDLVDGVGIYPGQEDELETDDIFRQYNELYTYLEMVPDYIEMVAIPGNHDAVRVADPQPAIGKDVLGKLAGLPNFRCLSSPSYVSLHGVEFLLYHGNSIHSIVPHVNTVGYSSPEMVVREYLQRRHLHPVYGERPPICPEQRDYMVIERVPDVVQVADVHKNGYMAYKGVVGVNAGCWQSITPYQTKLGHHPTPCVLPVMDLQTSKLNILRFDKEAIA